MQKLSSKNGLPITMRALRFLAIRLKSRPDTAQLADTVEAARAKLREAHDKWEEAVEERIAASAELEYLDSLLDRTVITLGYDARALVGGDHKDARYQKLFPESPSDAVKTVAGDHQTRFVRNIVDRLKNDSDLASLKAQAAPLEDALGKLDAAVAKRDELFIPEMRAQADRRIAIEHAHRTYNNMYPQLMLQLGEDMAESFFRKLRTKDGGSSNRGSTRVAPT